MVRALEGYKYKDDQLARYQTLTCLVEAKVVSKAMAMKIAGSGLEYGHLKCIVHRNGLDGITTAFKAKSTSGVRVTSLNNVIRAVFDYCSK